MERRTILRKSKAPSPEPEEEPKAEISELGEDTFQEPEVEHNIEAPKTPPAEEKKKKKKKAKKKKEEDEEETVLEIKPKKANNEKYAHLEKARQKSLETRRRKKEEQIRLKLEKEQLEKQLQQQKEMYEQKLQGYSSKLGAGAPAPPKEREEINYDLLAEKVYGRFQSMETNIRKQERELAEREYQERMKKPPQRPQLYTSTRKKPNRAFDTALNSGYMGYR